VHERLVDRRVERVAGLAEALHAELGQGALELVRDGGERPALQVAVLTRQVDVIQHRQQRLDDAADRRVMVQLTVTVDALLVVDVLGLQPLQVAGQVSSQRRVRMDFFALDRGVRTRGARTQAVRTGAHISGLLV
jgi:hypothetical protein